jgi:hypothetical protein
MLELDSLLNAVVLLFVSKGVNTVVGLSYIRNAGSLDQLHDIKQFPSFVSYFYCSR